MRILSSLLIRITGEPREARQKTLPTNQGRGWDIKGLALD
jgi:hypothetical protein